MNSARGAGSSASADVDSLRRHISDIVALSALSAVWAGTTARPQIAESLSQVLRETLDADLVDVGLRATTTGAADTALLEAIRAEVGAWLQHEGQVPPVPALAAFRGSTLVTPIGIHAEHGVIVTGQSDRDAPSNLYQLLLNVAANQATLALLSGRARDEQRIADTLQRIGTAVAAQLDPERVIQTVTDEATTLTGAWAAIDRNTDALIGLVEDLLDVSRIATGKIRLADTDVDLNEVVRDSTRAIEPAFAEKHVALSTETSAAPCSVRGDVARLRQVTGNLLSNAVKFTASGGRVSIAVTCDDRHVVLTVEDTGIGIHPDFLPHVFQRFRQGAAESTGGLGLGLAIVKNLVELHGGTVVAASDGIGRGSRFTVTLPRLNRPASL